jgi:hypothetical protein
MLLHKALFRLVITYACLAWESAADTNLLKLQCLQNKFLHTVRSFPRRTQVHDFHTAFSHPYVYDYITKLCKQQTEVIQNHENEYVHSTGQGKAGHKKYKRLTTIQVIKLPL